MQLQDLKPKTKRVKSRQIGRGGKRGKTSGRGHKGQKARAGHKIRPEIRDLIKKLPKRRGRGVNINRSHQVPIKAVSLARVAKEFGTNQPVTIKTLAAKGLIDRGVRKVKIVGTAELAGKLQVRGCAVSATARETIEKAGGTIS
ncbi:MAG: 50S ribosomal protein L15 [Candidatus Vogelbacteria bacterium CG10_big_fil_rev_8_21_14_0_10_50_13]|uniref:Large ribosomal subunit protein uL15 n=1 Tax=Candidatus Vogelbacteria bacterium CG10_big_fil_rev_8_21_14_0_10_50_13 TaxID=1975044 RepID=A0A2H0RGH2_9BACT|nr:MAG: 50S ribosomal protein L15 [Candidatus Vogelbacteria bacterium CG10_big_fil_rev_8_21_14_0_10_50_13]